VFFKKLKPEPNSFSIINSEAELLEPHKPKGTGDQWSGQSVVPALNRKFQIQNYYPTT